MKDVGRKDEMDPRSMQTSMNELCKAGESIRRLCCTGWPRRHLTCQSNGEYAGKSKTSFTGKLSGADLCRPELKLGELCS